MQISEFKVVLAITTHNQDLLDEVPGIRAGSCLLREPPPIPARMIKPPRFFLIDHVQYYQPNFECDRDYKPVLQDPQDGDHYNPAYDLLTALEVEGGEFLLAEMRSLVKSREKFAKAVIGAVDNASSPRTLAAFPHLGTIKDPRFRVVHKIEVKPAKQGQKNPSLCGSSRPTEPADLERLLVFLDSLPVSAVADWRAEVVRRCGG